MIGLGRGKPDEIRAHVHSMGRKAQVHRTDRAQYADQVRGWGTYVKLSVHKPGFGYSYKGKGGAMV